MLVLPIRRAGIARPRARACQRGTKMHARQTLFLPEEAATTLWSLGAAQSAKRCLIAARALLLRRALGATTLGNASRSQIPQTL